MTVSARNLRRPARFPCLIDSSPLTMVTLLQMSRKVMTAVNGTPRTVDGIGQAGLPMRSAA